MTDLEYSLLLEEFIYWMAEGKTSYTIEHQLFDKKLDREYKKTLISETLKILRESYSNVYSEFILGNK